jgi:hypothetical protein
MTPITTNSEALMYYATPGPLTDLSAHAALVHALPDGLPNLCRVVQGLVVHPFLAHLYGLASSALRRDELEIRAASDMVNCIFALDSRPLVEPRTPDRRLVGNCRHFTVLLCSILRAQGVPARARCGFATYFDPPRFIDHWVCEVWDETRGWYLVDAQLDACQCDALQIPFGPLNVPRTQFLVAGEAWQQCRSGCADPESFGILDLHGLWFVRGNLVRDLAARAKRELLPWDGWGLMGEHDRESEATELALLDRVAELTQAGDERHAELLKLQGAEPGLRVPREIVSFNLGSAKIDLGSGVAN